MTTVQMDRRVYKLQAEILKALASPVRLEILQAELLASLGISKANLSQHLASQHLALPRNTRIVTDRREGVNTLYRLTYPEIEEACQAVGQALAKHLLEVGEQARVLLRGASRF